MEELRVLKEKIRQRANEARKVASLDDYYSGKYSAYMEALDLIEEAFYEPSAHVPPPASPSYFNIENKVPALYQDVEFIVESSDENQDGRILGGRYQGKIFGCHEFSTPAQGWRASYWRPLEEAG